MSGHQHDEKDEEEVEQEQARGLPPENQNTVELVIDFTTQLVDR